MGGYVLSGGTICWAILMCVTIAQVLCSPPILSSTSYNVREIRIDNDNFAVVALFDLVFDQDLYVNGVPLSSFASSSSSSVSLFPLPSGAPPVCVLGCKDMTGFTHTMLGSMELICMTQNNVSSRISSSPSFYNLDPTSTAPTPLLVPLPPSSSGDPLIALLDPNAALPSYSSSHGNVLSAAVILSVYKDASQLTLPDMAIRNKLKSPSFVTTNCYMTVTSASGEGDESSDSSSSSESPPTSAASQDATITTAAEPSFHTYDTTSSVLSSSTASSDTISTTSGTPTTASVSSSSSPSHTTTISLTNTGSSASTISPSTTSRGTSGAASGSTSSSPTTTRSSTTGSTGSGVTTTGSTPSTTTGATTRSTTTYAGTTTRAPTTTTTTGSTSSTTRSATTTTTSTSGTQLTTSYTLSHYTGKVGVAKKNRNAMFADLGGDIDSSSVYSSVAAFGRRMMSRHASTPTTAYVSNVNNETIQDGFMSIAPSFGPSSSNPCRYVLVNAVSITVRQLIANVTNSKNWEQLEQAQMMLSAWMSHPYLQACEKHVTSGLVTSSQVAKLSPVTQECVTDRNLYPEAWGTDPCCNDTLAFYTCCAPRKMNVNINLVNGLAKQTSGYTYQAMCKHPQQALPVLLDFLDSTNTGQDPLSGCETSAQSIANREEYDSYFAFIEECNVRVWGAGQTLPQCSSDAECYTKCDVYSGQCKAPLPDPDVYMVRCHMEKMAPEVERYLRVMWNISTNASRDQFASEYTKRLRTDNCVGSFASYFTWANDPETGKIVWQNSNRDDCLSVQACNYDARLQQSSAQCSAAEGICASCQGDLCLPRYYPPMCFMVSPTQDHCEAHGGVWNPDMRGYECTLPQFTSLESCLDPSVCPDPTLEVRVRPSSTYASCAGPTCYTRRTQTNCTTIGASSCSNKPAIVHRWDRTYRRGSGLCLEVAPTEAMCTGAGGEWWPGRGWVPGRFLEKEECEAGVCLAGNVQLVGKSPDPVECANHMYCDGSIKACQSTTNTSYCHGSATTSCGCASEGGYFDRLSSLCLHSFFTRDRCEKANRTWVECGDLSLDECTLCEGNDASCRTPYRNMQCSRAYGAKANTQKACHASGTCSDFNDIYNYLHPLCQNAFSQFLDPICLGACVGEFSVSPSGSPYCPPYLVERAIGCVNYTALSPHECAQVPGATWMTAAWTEDQCLARKRCYQKDSLISTNKQIEECTACSGEMRSVYKWRPSRWVYGQPYPLQWLRANFSSVNKWQPTLDFNLLQQAVGQAITYQFALARQTEAMCSFNPQVQAFRLLSCDCTNDPDAPSQCYSGDTSEVSVGVQRFCNGLSGWARSGAVTLSVGSDAVPLLDQCLTISVLEVAATQFATSSQFLQAVQVTSQNPYARVVNSYGVAVGQLVGNGAKLILVGKTQDVHLSSPMKICIRSRSDIAVSSDYNVMDFATSNDDYSQWTPLNINVEEDELGNMCGNLSVLPSQSVVWPIKRVSEWQSLTQGSSSFSPAETGFIYVVAAMFLAMALCAVVCLIRGVRRQGWKLQLGKIIIAIVFVFALDRGIYLSLVPSGILASTKTSILPALYLLSELPIFLFFSAYSALIFFWAELSLFVSTMKGKSFLQVLRIPFLITNILLYAIFVVFICVYHSAPASTQPQLALAYRMVLTCCALLVILFACIYGGKIIAFQAKMWQTKGGSGLRHGPVLRMLAIVVTCTIGLALQVAYLLNTQFNPSRTPTYIVLLYYILAEFLPLCALLLCMAANTRQGSATPSTKHDSTIKLKATATATAETGSNTGTSSTSLRASASSGSMSSGMDSDKATNSDDV
eukprot:TRINITY_DN1330_c0_g1_i2.p1 TRINITY_DN1330_c0_g1~~TRINITY_DN1330_c0_g1_i2.p1  ORF type:complete len:1821 (-),score=373.82 TRINITY_DN1330_c0_g1_i2:55-5484(-)